MRFQFLTFILLFALLGCNPKTKDESTKKSKPAEKHKYAMVIHGGAGYMNDNPASKKANDLYLAVLDSVLTIGETILKNGGTSMDAVVECISFMEDKPIFNAGKGAVFNHEGENELDASIMKGDDLNAGAVAGVKTIKNPIKAAKEVLFNSRHVLLTGQGAQDFAKIQNIELVDNNYFYSKKSFDYLQQVLKEEKSSGKHSLGAEVEKTKKHGTVGCVALDMQGNIVAGTSTGGLTNKKFNRVGDSPIIGAGTYANNKTCGVSCTGVGEFFMRYAIAHEMSSILDHTDLNVEQAAEKLINGTLKNIDAAGGLIALDYAGNAAMSFNTTSMLRGYINPDVRYVKIFKD